MGVLQAVTPVPTAGPFDWVPAVLVLVGLIALIVGLAIFSKRR